MPVNILTTTVSIPFNKVSKTNIDKLILRDLKNKYEKKCCSHGYTKENSISIIHPYLITFMYVHTYMRGFIKAFS